jgi:hypothetical protein
MPERAAGPAGACGDALDGIEQVLDRLRLTLSPLTTIAASRYVADLEQVLERLRRTQAAHRARTRALRRLATRCAVTAEASRVRAASTADAELRGRLLGQAAALEHLAERLGLLAGDP